MKLLLQFLQRVALPLILLLINTNSFGQLTTTNAPPYNSVNFLVQNVLMGNGITASNISSQGTAVQIGYFDGSNSNIGLSRGVFMTTGDISTAGGANISGSTSADNLGAGDADLDGLLTGGQSSQDVASISFDFVPIGDSVIFRYVFASEEYNEYVCSDFNDVFGFFISGPGYPPGGSNIALVPGGNIPVAINTVNNGTPGSAAPGPMNCDNADPNWAANSVYYIDNDLGPTVEFDGFTVVLEARALVECGETYTIKMAVGDAGDGALDSGVFLEAESFSSPGITVDVTTVSGDTTIVEGCALATFTFIRPDAVGDLTVGYEIAGNAINGVDYQFIPDSIVIPDGNLTGSISIIPIADGIIEGSDTVFVTVYNITQCGDTIPEVAVILIEDENSLVVDAPDVISNCPGDTVQLNASTTGGTPVYLYTWNNGDSGATIDVAPMQTDTFVVESFDDDGCLGYDTTIVSVLPLFTPNAGSDTVLCTGAGVVIGGAPTGPAGSTYLWTPSTGLSSDTDPNPTATPGASQEYIVAVTSALGCTVEDTVQVDVSSTPPVNAGNDVEICDGNTTTLSASGGTDYAWNTEATLSDTSISNPMAAPLSTTMYYVTISNIAGCSGIDSVQVTVNPLPSVNPGNDTTLCTGESVTLGGSPTGTGTFAWLPNGTLDDPTSGNPVATPIGSTTYTVTVTDANNCVNTGSVDVTLNPLPIVDAGAPAQFCEGDSAQLNASGALNYVWSPTDSITNINIANPFVFPATTTTYTVVGIDINNCQNTDNVTITVNPTPTANAGNDIDYLCPGSSVQLNATGGSNYVWSPGATLDNPNISNPVCTPTDTVNLEVLVTDGNGCTDIDSIQIIVNDNPPADAGSDTTLCIGNSVGIGGNPTSIVGSTFSWSQATTLNNGTNANPIASPTSNTTYVVTVSNDTCTNTDTVTVSVFTPPSISAGNDVQICIGDSSQLLASGGISYTWTPANSLSNDTIIDPWAKPNDTTTYTVTGTDGNGCTNTDQVIVIVNPEPGVSFSGTSAICQNDSTELTATGGQSYSWTPTANTINSNASTVTVFPTNNQYYTVSVTDSNGCIGSDSIEVEVNALPNVDAGQNTAICIGDSTQLSATGAVNYAWSPGNSLSNPNISDPWSTTTATESYIVVGTDANNCVNSDTVHISVNALPIISAGSDVQICLGDSTQLQATGGATYLWSPSASLDDPTSDSPWTSITDTTVFSLTGTDISGCTNTSSVTVIVNPIPSVITSAGPSICLGDTANLSVSGADTYEWTPANPLVNPNLSSVEAFPDTNTIFTVVGTDTNGCVSNDTVQVLVFRIGTIGDTILCEGDSIQLQVYGSEANTYLWTPSTGLSDPNVSNPWASPTSDITYSISATNIAGCNDQESVSVIMLSAPTADFTFELDAGCEGAVVTFTNNTTNATGYEWNIDGQSTDEEHPQVTIPFSSNFTATLIAYNDEGCDQTTSKDGVSLSFDDYFDINIPNVFTPNMDGINDRYEVEVAGYLYECADMQIFNRWGQVMFKSTGHNLKWDGRTNVGEECPEGIYFMTVDIGETKHSTTLYLFR